MKMLAIGTQFSTDFRSQQWRAVELMEGLMNEVYSDGEKI